MSRELKTIAQFSNETSFSEPQLRYWVQAAQINGLAKHSAVKRIGRRVYLDVAAFYAWVESQNNKPASA